MSVIHWKAILSVHLWYTVKTWFQVIFKKIHTNTFYTKKRLKSVFLNELLIIFYTYIRTICSIFSMYFDISYIKIYQVELKLAKSKTQNFSGE